MVDLIPLADGGELRRVPWNELKTVWLWELYKVGHYQRTLDRHEQLFVDGALRAADERTDPS